MNPPKPPSPPEAQGCGNRRTFVRVAAGGVGLCYAAAFAYPVYRYLESPVEKSASLAAVSEVSLPEAHKLAPGTALMFKFGSRPALLIHHPDDEWVALIAVCTHLGCTVQYQGDQGRIYCACHGGVYNARTGGNVSGPPPKPLERLEVKRTESAVVVSRPARTA